MGSRAARGATTLVYAVCFVCLYFSGANLQRNTAKILAGPGVGDSLLCAQERASIHGMLTSPFRIAYTTNSAVL